MASATQPRMYPGVMVSSTFTDLEQHRAALINAIKGQGLSDVAMENDSAKLIDVIESSLLMVADASAYIGVISHRYGQTPVCPKRNPNELSITELEFNEAQRLERPILLFIMGNDHPVRRADVETDPAKMKKLEAFRERAKQMGPDSQVHCVYATFNSLEDFNTKAIHSVAELRRYLDKTLAHKAEPQAVVSPSRQTDPIPTPPDFYAEPRYIGSHEFVGRREELERLSDWALPADPHPVLLFDAIGGSGKSMMTWEWTTQHATKTRKDWAGRFWYSFYERGAIMADFCRCALAYMTGQPRDSFNKMKTPELGEKLVHHLQNRPWLLILDGLERVLVAYHRFDAADVADEEANQPTDQIAHRDPCAAIRPEDDDLLRAFAAAAPSKILISSRLVPRVLLNQAVQPIPGVLRVPLPGLRPADAEALLRSCGINGKSEAIKSYLKTHCDCHPLVTGVLAGLINGYLPARGNFDAWAADHAGGGQLDLADLDLTQKRNHILKAAIGSLSGKSRELLSILALLSEAVDYLMLSSLNPHLPPQPEEVDIPKDPESSWQWERIRKADKKKAKQEYQAGVRRRQEYEQAVEARLQSQEFRAAPRKLADTVCDLERRSLLQYDRSTGRYDLHPVVRSVAAGGLRPEEKEGYGQRVVDHFSEQTHRPYKKAETLEDVRDGLRIVRTLLRMGHYQQAAKLLLDSLSRALFFNLEAHAEHLSLLRPFFHLGWAALPPVVRKKDAIYLASDAGITLEKAGEPVESLAIHGSVLVAHLKEAAWDSVGATLCNIFVSLQSQGRLAQADVCISLALDLAKLTGSRLNMFMSRYFRFGQLAIVGRWSEAQSIWDALVAHRPQFDSPVPWSDAEYNYAVFSFWQGKVGAEHLAYAIQLAQAEKNRLMLRLLHGLRGECRLERGEWLLAAESLHEAVSMARGVGQFDAKAETQLALAQFRLCRLGDPRLEAEQLTNSRSVHRLSLGELWYAIGDREQAKKYALEAYKIAWADGEPYVWRYELNKSRALLEKLGAGIPNLPPYDLAEREKFPWADELVAAIAKLRTNRAAPFSTDARWHEETSLGKGGTV